MSDGDLVLQVPVDRLLEICDPTKVTAWGWVIHPGEVEKAVEEGRLQATPWDPSKPKNQRREIQYHTERVAYFVVHGWSDPIDLDVGVPSLGCHVGWMIQDGNHRFYAAVIRKDQHILSTLSGSLDYAQEILGIPITLSV